MTEHKALEAKITNMQDTLKEYKDDAKDFRKEIKDDIWHLTDTVNIFIIDMKEKNITRKEAEAKFTTKSSFKVWVTVVSVIATLIWIFVLFVK